MNMFSYHVRFLNTQQHGSFPRPLATATNRSPFQIAHFPPGWPGYCLQYILKETFPSFNCAAAAISVTGVRHDNCALTGTWRNEVGYAELGKKD